MMCTLKKTYTGTEATAMSIGTADDVQGIARAVVVIADELERERERERNTSNSTSKAKASL